MSASILTLEDSASPGMAIRIAMVGAGYGLTEAAGANGWLVKPFVPGQLVEVTRKVLMQ